MTITIYGIRNCAIMKKARTWLDAHRVEHRFHEYKVEGIDRERLDAWCAELGWGALLNRSGTTFRKLPEPLKEGLSAFRAIGLMLEQPSMIKRPVLDLGGMRLVGFKAETYAACVSKTV